MTTNAQIRASLADKLRELPQLNVFEYPVDNIVTPCAVVANIERQRITNDGGWQVGVIVHVLASHNHIDQMAKVDDLVDPNVTASVPSVIEDDDDLALCVPTIGSLGLYEYAGTIYYGAPVTVEVVD
jgi:hypothetical protein